MEKKCTKCGELKSTEHFHKDKNKTLGVRNQCKLCVKDYGTQNRARISAVNREWYNKNKRNNLNRDVYTYAPDRRCAMCSKIKPATHFSTSVSAKSGLESRCKKCMSNRAIKYKFERSKKDPVFAYSETIRKAVQSAFRQYAGTQYSQVNEILGCDVKELRAHIESNFEHGMSWENYGLRGWHLDHIIPKTYFDLSTFEGQKLANHWDNLWPRWQRDNIRKSNIIEPIHEVMLVSFKHLIKEENYV